MRSWAFIISASYFIFFVSDKRMFQNAFGFIDFKNGSDKRLWTTIISINALIFVTLSELLWHYTSFEVWVWYHAFLFINVLLPYLLFLLLARMILGEKENKDLTDEIIEKRNPPLEGSEGERYDIFLRKPNRVFHKYRNITFHQTKTIFSKIKWQKELDAYEGEQKEVNENTKPAFIIEFGGGYQFYLEPINDIVTKLKWASPKERKFFETWVTPNQHEAFDVPLDLIPELMRLCWIEEWGVMTNKLQPYIQTGAE